jgi:para-aminobenzoate synthetase component 1
MDFGRQTLDFNGRRIKGENPLAVFDASQLSFEDLRSHLQTLALHYPEGGAIGYFSYEAAKEWEPSAYSFSYPQAVPLFRLVAYQKLNFSSNENLNASPHSSLEMRELSEVAQRSKWYKSGVEEIRQYIGAGDIYQANLTCRIETETDFSPSAIYERLAYNWPFQPPQQGALLEWDDFSVVSNSPESFLTLKDGVLESKPIKGTTARDTDPLELQNDPKNRAENVMIVDLLRNDLGRVCDFGTVHVPHLCEIETFPTLHHLVSTVRGNLRHDLTMFDAFKAAFPCGSITGAPKIRAMQILSELEPTARDISMGAIGYFGFNQTMEWNVAIRTATIIGRTAHFQVGGGIVTDSEPQSEYEEMKLKARALWSALTG